MKRARLAPFTNVEIARWYGKGFGRRGRARIDLFRQTDPFLEADVEPVIETGMTDKDPEVVVRALMSRQFELYVKLNRKDSARSCLIGGANSAADWPI